MTHTLVLKGKAGLVWLWFIDTTKYTSLLLSQYKNQTIKIRLSKVNHKELKKKLIQHNVLLFVWDPNQLSDKIGVSTKKNYIKVQMQTLSKSDNTFLITKMLENGHFPFTYNRNEIKTGEKDFHELEQIVYNFFHNEIIVVKAQIYSCLPTTKMRLKRVRRTFLSLNEPFMTFFTTKLLQLRLKFIC